MNIEIRYQSRTGHTKAVAEAMGKAIGVTPKDIKTPVTKPTDILFIGGGIYAFQTDPELVAFMKNLDPEKVKKVVVYATSGMLKGTLKKLQRLTKRKKIPLHPETLLLIIPQKTAPTKSQLEQAANFAKSVK